MDFVVRVRRTACGNTLGPQLAWQPTKGLSKGSLLARYTGSTPHYKCNHPGGDCHPGRGVVPRYTRIGPTQLSTFTTIYLSTDMDLFDQWFLDSSNLLTPLQDKKQKTWLKMAILPIEWEVNIKQNLPTTHFLFPFLFSPRLTEHPQVSAYGFQTCGKSYRPGTFSRVKETSHSREDPWNTEVTPRWI